MNKKMRLLLSIILFVGALLRICGINFGLPYQFHQDEPIIVHHALAYGAGDLNPHFFIIPPLTSYILFFFYGIYYLLLNLSGVLKGTEAFAASFFRDPTVFYLIGRIVIGFMPSVFNIYLTYRLASEFFTIRAAIYSALVMAVVFLNVINGHYIYTDNLLVTFVLLSYLAMAAVIKKPSIGNYVIAAVFTAAAIAIKYNAALLIIVFFAAHFICKIENPIKNGSFIKLSIFFLVTALVFILCNPFSILDWKFFLLSITGRIRHEYIGWAHHLKYSLFEGVGVAMTFAGLAGLILHFKINVKKAFFLILFPLLFYLHLVFASQAFSRYVLALIPFLALGMAYLFYDYFYPKSRSPLTRFIIITISFLAVIPTSIKSVKADSLFCVQDTRAEAAKWIEDNIPAGAKIALDHTFFCPPIKQSIEQLREKESVLNKQPELKDLKTKKLSFQSKSDRNGKTYEVYYIIQGNEVVGQFLTFWPVIKNDLTILEEKGIEYVVISNIKTQAVQKQLEQHYKPLVKFSPYKSGEFRKPYDETDPTCIPIGSREVFSRQRPGPYMVIYKIK